MCFIALVCLAALLAVGYYHRNTFFVQLIFGCIAFVFFGGLLYKIPQLMTVALTVFSIPYTCRTLQMLITSKSLRMQNILEEVKDCAFMLNSTFPAVSGQLFAHFMISCNRNLSRKQLSAWWGLKRHSSAMTSEISGTGEEDVKRCQAFQNWCHGLKTLMNSPWQMLIPGELQSINSLNSREDQFMQTTAIFGIMAVLSPNFIPSLAGKSPIEWVQEFNTEWQTCLSNFVSNTSSPIANTVLSNIFITFSSYYLENVFFYIFISFTLHTTFTSAMSYLSFLVLKCFTKPAKTKYMRFSPMYFVLLVITCLLFENGISVRRGTSTLTALLHLRNAKIIPIVVHGETKINNSAACHRYADYLLVANDKTVDSTRSLRNNIHALIKQSTNYGFRFPYSENEKPQYDALVGGKEAKDSVFYDLLGKGQTSLDMTQGMAKYNKAISDAIRSGSCSPYDESASSLDVAVDINCVKAWSKIEHNPNPSRRNDATSRDVQQSLIRGALLTCLLESNSIRSEFYQSFAFLKISMIEWPWAKVFYKMTLIVDSKDIEIMWHEVLTESVTQRLDIAKERHSNMPFIVCKYISIFFTVVVILYFDPNHTFACVFSSIKTCYGRCCGHVQDGMMWCWTKCNGHLWIAVALLLGLSLLWFFGSGSGPGSCSGSGPGSSA